MAATANSWHSLYLSGYQYLKLFAALNSSGLLNLSITKSIPKDTIKAYKVHYILIWMHLLVVFFTGIGLEGKQAPTRIQGQTVQSIKVLSVLMNKTHP